MATPQPIGKDFYFRSPGDPNYTENTFESNDSLENAIQQVRMVLLTRTGEVLGEDIGFNAEKHLFEFEFASLSEMESDANAQIAEFVLLSKHYNIDARAITLDDIADPYKVGVGLDIKINGESAFATLFDL
jgi:hypothetical protein